MCYNSNVIKRPVGQEAKTPPSHGGIRGSIPLRVTIQKIRSHTRTDFLYYSLFIIHFSYRLSNKLYVLFLIRKIYPCKFCTVNSNTRRCNKRIFPILKVFNNRHRIVSEIYSKFTCHIVCH